MSEKQFNMQLAGQRIKSLREKAGCTPEQVAKSIGISISSYMKYEAGLRVPRDEVKMRIANYFDKSIGLIFFS